VPRSRVGEKFSGLTYKSFAENFCPLKKAIQNSPANGKLHLHFTLLYCRFINRSGHPSTFGFCVQILKQHLVAQASCL
jgi:hypothetical protein